MRLFAFLLAAMSALSQTSLEDEVRAAEFEFNQARLQNDVAALELILAPDYVSFNQWGFRRDRKAALQLFRTFRTTSLEASDVTIHVNGDTATVDGHVRESRRESFNFLRTYVKRGGRWQLLANFQALTVDPDSLTAVNAGTPTPVATHPVTGRRIAPVMGVRSANGLDRPARDSADQPDMALAALGISKGDTVADIGAGTGYFTWRLAELVGPAGKVYASDIQPALLKRLEENMKKRSLTNFESLLGTPDDPRLPGTSIDLALLVDSYHEFAEPQKMIDRIRESLKPGGRMVLIEYRREDEKFGAADKHLMSVADAKAEIEAQGFTLDNILEILPTQHILIFRISSNK